MLGDCLYKAVGSVMERHEMPARRVHELDNRDTNFFIALHWTEFLANEDAKYKPVFDELSKHQDAILTEIKKSQGTEVDLGGYYLFDYKKTSAAMNPSETLNQILGHVAM